MDLNRAGELLARERRRTEEEIERLRPVPDEELSHADQHPADTGTELFGQELDEGLALDLREKLAAIERAERRLEEGTYGLSVETGEPIPDERLEVMPWAERTVQEETRRGLG